MVLAVVSGFKNVWIRLKLAFMAPKSKPQNYYVFSSFTIKVHDEGSRQMRKMIFLKVFDSFEAVLHSHIRDDGMVTIKGEHDPSKVIRCLAKLGKSVTMIQWQSTERSTNLIEQQKVVAQAKSCSSWLDYVSPSTMEL